ncbi:adenosine kinase [Epibacterium sp. SM1979]|uniref:Adenosine kinase n=1 Tax=Tritonibacter litoralis TaxID=2662264 RepID=A0A843YLQ6_9RHOB|nr:adenosine kinase [Tritonibacter litoralis]MQQ10354.1 adenosine kinase [Tritonibacter litoralis]
MKTYQLVGIGNAVVDVISQCDDSFLEHMGIEKGIMQLIERDRGEVLYAAMNDRVQTPGGSVANTIAGAGALGLDAAFIGRVHDDALGQFYAKAMQDDGVDFVNPPVAGGELPTSRSMIFVSPDGERSMNTYLGISSEVSSADVPAGVAENAQIVFLEGYLFDKDKGKSAFREAARAAKAGGGKAGIAISDPFCVERHRDDFLSLIEHDLDYVIGNEDEIKSLFESDDLEAALTKTAAICPLVVCNRSGDGVIVLSEGARVEVPVEKITPVDATGAGDQFAAGFLFGMATGRDLETSARIGCICAGEVIRHIGPRPQTNVRDLLTAAGLL